MSSRTDSQPVSSQTDPPQASPQINQTPVLTAHPPPVPQQPAADDTNRPNNETTNVPEQHADSDEEAAAWGRCAEVLHANDKSLLQGWKDEIDTLLVFAGLFSAVLTTFNAQSYQLLQSNPADASVALLMQISLQLDSFVINPSFINSTNPTSLNPQTTFEVPSYAVRVNVLWFSSLIFSLAAASIGILVKQWLNQYSHELIGYPPSHESARLRQYRYEGLVKWRVVAILTLLPLLLQIALALFLVGLVDLLWNIHRAVAIVATVLVAVLLLFSTFTIILPSFARDCFYKSPQALGFFLLVQQVLRMWRALCRLMWRAPDLMDLRYMSWSYLLFSFRLLSFLSSISRRSSSFCYSIGRWLQAASRGSIDRRKFSSFLSSIHAWPDVASKGHTYYSWREQERESVRQLEDVLDRGILSASDAIKMDDDFLEKTIEPCFRTVKVAVVVSCYDEILLHRADRLNDLAGTWTHSRGVKAVNAALSLTLCVMEKLQTVKKLDQKRQLLRILSSSVSQLWGEIGNGRIEYPVTTRLLNSLAQMFLRQDTEAQAVVFIIRQVCAVRGILPSFAHNAQFIDALLKDPHGTGLILDACLAGLKAETSGNPSSNDDEETQNRIRQILSYLRRYIETEGYKYCDKHRFLSPMQDLCGKMLLVAQTFPGLIEAPDELAAMLWKAAEEKILEIDTDELGRWLGSTIFDALWIMATLATSTDTELQARELRDLRWTTFVDFCSESLHAATSENPSSNDGEERRNRIRYMLSYLRQYIETEGYKYCDESGFLRNMECLCREILLAAQVFPQSIEVPDELAAMLRKAIKAKLTKVEDYDQDFITRYNEGNVWDDLSAIEALATTSTQPQASGSKGKGAQVNLTGNSRSSILHEEADVQSESHGEPSNSLVTSSGQLDQGAEGQFGGKEDQNASPRSSLSRERRRGTDITTGLSLSDGEHVDCDGHDEDMVL